jgi:hypothetical protein
LKKRKGKRRSDEKKHTHTQHNTNIDKTYDTEQHFKKKKKKEMARVSNQSQPNKKERG